MFEFFIFILFSPIHGDLIPPQFSNPFYSAFGYLGSRILETNYTTNRYVDATWWQSSTVDSTGTVFLAQPDRNTVIKISASTANINFPVKGTVLTGKSNRQGYRDGTLDVAEFNSLQGIAVRETDSVTYLYVADTGNHVLRRIDLSSGVVDTLAGVAGKNGAEDGDGRKALFNYPTSVGIDPESGLIFVLDGMGSLIRMIKEDKSKDGTTESVSVSTLVSGACHTIEATQVYSTIFKRVVRCQTNWVTSVWSLAQSWPTLCLGNEVTCNTRYDRSSEL